MGQSLDCVTAFQAHGTSPRVYCTVTNEQIAVIIVLLREAGQEASEGRMRRRWQRMGEKEVLGWRTG